MKASRSSSTVEDVICGTVMIMLIVVMMSAVWMILPASLLQSMLATAGFVSIIGIVMFGFVDMFRTEPLPPKGKTSPPLSSRHGKSSTPQQTPPTDEPANDVRQPDDRTKDEESFTVPAGYMRIVQDGGKLMTLPAGNYKVTFKHRFVEMMVTPVDYDTYPEKEPAPTIDIPAGLFLVECRDTMGYSGHDDELRDVAIWMRICHPKRFCLMNAGRCIQYVVRYVQDALDDLVAMTPMPRIKQAIRGAIPHMNEELTTEVGVEIKRIFVTCPKRKRTRGSSSDSGTDEDESEPDEAQVRVRDVDDKIEDDEEDDNGDVCDIQAALDDGDDSSDTPTDEEGEASTVAGDQDSHEVTFLGSESSASSRSDGSWERCGTI
ncbi:Band 7 domain-containing protein [Plasmodiophora brassicae]|uniref:Uncharacterized protein n=1 Tax=Plasmodiophora brassicae TaxID=37360 RepID=A0A0G4IZ98_PLABS|nr:hypothetical protein PBRA_001659 [Plasmodiophora brassicae]SPQ93903.1 unnamed protein product [Plasmodiophora brassicae]